MPTAKESFLKSTARASFETIAMAPAFVAATEYALLSFAENQPNETDPNSACAAHYRLEGARDVLNTLKTLHVPIEQPQTPRVQTLRPPK